MNKRGYTLIEVVVAMGIFLTILTLAIGAYVSIVRVRSVTTNMRDSQQKLRMATEKISRLSREANKVTVSDTGPLSGRMLDLVFYKSSTSGYKARFTIALVGTNYELRERECFWTVLPECDITLAPENEMLGGTVVLASTSGFNKSSNGISRILEIGLDGRIGNALSPYFARDDFSLRPSVILEGIR